MSGAANCTQSASCGRQAIRYDRYRLSVPEAVFGMLQGTAICALLAYTFYRSLVAFALMLPMGLVLGAVWERQKRLENRRQELARQFKEGMTILAASLSAGYSIENALAAGVQELSALYGEDGLIVREFSYMVQQIRMNRPVEWALDEFAKRCGMEDVHSFAEVFAVAKRSSGDLGSIMRHTAEIIHDKMQVKEEIATLTASRRFEQKIMNLIPFFIVFYVDSASPGFLIRCIGRWLGVF